MQLYVLQYQIQTQHKRDNPQYELNRLRKSLEIGHPYKTIIANIIAVVLRDHMH
jgi:hypothetical protein